MAKADEKSDKKSSSGRLVKYMGFVDERSILKDDTFGGRLPDGFGVDAVWNEANNHLVELDLDPDVLDLLLNTQVERDGVGDFVPAFKDVTGMKVVPRNGWAERWRPQGEPDARKASAMVGATGLGAVSSTTAGAYGAGTTGGSGTGSDATTT